MIQETQLTPYETLLSLLDRGDRETTVAFLAELDPNNTVHLLGQVDDSALQRLLGVVGRQTLADVLADFDPEDAARHLERLDVAQAADLTERMDPDDAADVIHEMGDEGAAQILDEMVPEESKEVRALLEYPPESAGGLMTPEFVAVKAYWTVGGTIRYVRTRAHEAETIYYLYVSDNHGTLCGVLSLKDLILANEFDRISTVMNEAVHYATVDDDQEAVANLISEEDLLALPVVDFNHHLVGIVTVDDVLDVIEAEYGEDLLKFSAIEGGEERSLSSPSYSIRHRMPWLLVNILLSQVGALVVTLFQDTLAQVVVLATFMPVISNMGGNVGIQAVSVAIRGISTGEVAFRNFWTVLRKEVIVGFFNGLILGALMGGIAYLWHGSYYLGVVTTLALWANVMVASLCGGTFPFLLQRAGFDPAMMTGPLLTTVVDLISFFIFLGLGTLMLPLLR